MKFHIAFILRLSCLWLLASSAMTNADTLENKITVKVGGYQFAPFVEVDHQSVSGLTLDLIALLNQEQSKYHFSFILTSPKRRYLDFERKQFDALFFESIHWSWKDKNILASDVFLTGGEVYISSKQDNKTQAYFDSITKKSLVGILGYHYGFADFNANEMELKKAFNIQLVHSPSTIINQVLANKSNIGIITKSYLKKQMKQQTNLANEILISNKFDQEYQHTILMRNNSQPSITEINHLIKTIQGNGQLASLLSKYGL